MPNNNIKADIFKSLIKGIENQLGRKIQIADIAIVNPEKPTLSGVFEISAVDKKTFVNKVKEDGPIFNEEVGIVKAEDMVSTQQPTQPVHKRPKM